MKGPLQLTTERLRQLLSYDPETGVFVRLVKSGSAKPGDVAGSLNGCGYVVIWVDGFPHLAHRLAWLYVYGGWPAEFIDHANMRRNDNRLENLRAASRSQNGANRTAHSRNSSGVKGVTWHRRDKVWRVKCGVNGRQHDVGAFKSLDEARAAYANFSQTHHGEFSRPC